MKGIVLRHIIYFTVICLYLCVIGIFEIGCPILYFFNIECPTCGVTRALISLIRLDFNGYIMYHPLALPLIVAVWIFFHGKIIKRKRTAYLIAGAILFLNTALYIMRFVEAH